MCVAFCYYCHAYRTVMQSVDGCIPRYFYPLRSLAIVSDICIYIYYMSDIQLLAGRADDKASFAGRSSSNHLDRCFDRRYPHGDHRNNRS